MAEKPSNIRQVGKNSGKAQMDRTQYGVVAVVGIGIVAFAVYSFWPENAKPVLAPTCPAILPASSASNGYAFYATDGNGDFAYGVLHFYPNGFRHNASVLIDQGNSPSADPVTLYDISVPGGCVPSDGSQPATLTLTQNGAPAAVLHFSSPASDPNAMFAVTFAPATGSSGTPQPSMTGNAYLIGNQ